MKNKKGEGMSMQVIVIAILCLIVMAVLIYIFAGKMGLIKSSTTCIARDGKCTASNVECSPEKPVSIWTEDCGIKGEPGKCCVAIG
jgi:hypothetical protein